MWLQGWHPVNPAKGLLLLYYQCFFGMRQCKSIRVAQAPCILRPPRRCALVGSTDIGYAGLGKATRTSLTNRCPIELEKLYQYLSGGDTVGGQIGELAVLLYDRKFSQLKRFGHSQPSHPSEPDMGNKC
jgi:hypothetical protein